MEKKELTITERLALLKAKSKVSLEEGNAVLEKSAERGRELDEKVRSAKIDYDRYLVHVSKGKRPRDFESAIPNLQEKIAATHARLKRSKELEESQQRIIDELAAIPLEKQMNAVYAQMGQELYRLQQEEIEEATEADAFLEEDERGDKAEEALERSGQPPPLRLIK